MKRLIALSLIKISIFFAVVMISGCQKINPDELTGKVQEFGESNPKVLSLISLAKKKTQAISLNEISFTIPYDSSIQFKIKESDSGNLRGLTLLLEEGNSVTLKYQQPVFTTDLKYQEDLDNNILSKDFKDIFKENQFEFSDNITITKGNLEQNWILNDDDRERGYFEIKSDRTKLNIFLIPNIELPDTILVSDKTAISIDHNNNSFINEKSFELSTISEYGGFLEITCGSSLDKSSDKETQECLISILENQ